MSGKAQVIWYQDFLEKREELCLRKRNLAQGKRSYGGVLERRASFSCEDCWGGWVPHSQRTPEGLQELKGRFLWSRGSLH